MPKFSQIANYFFLCLFALLSFLIHYLTPMQSDDYNFSLFGYADVWDRYFSWSGRILAEFFAISLMNISNKFILAILQTLAMTSLLYFVSQIPFKALHLKFNSWAFVFIAALYWLFHPDLGQSTFWVVGAAVYMWTTLIVSIFLWKVLAYYYKKEETKEVNSIVLFILAFFAGCTNENVGVLIAALVGILGLHRWIRTKKLDFKLMLSSLFSGIGALILVVAPGNQKRLKNWEYYNNKIWGEISITEKFNMFEDQYWAFLKYPILLLIGIYILLFFFKKWKLKDEQNRISYFALSLLFFFFSFLSYEVLFLSPIHPNRSMSGSFFFLLLALTFGYYELSRLEDGEGNLSIRQIKIALPAVLLGMFISLYFGKILPLYQSYHAQQKVQLEQIKGFQNSDSKKAKIPRIFISEKLADERLDIDKYENPKSIATYYGLNSAEYYDVQMDLRDVKDFKALFQTSLRVKVDIITEKDFTLVLAFKDGTNENFDADHKISKKLKASKDSIQTIEYILPIGAEIQNLRLDIDGKDIVKFRLEKLTILDNKRKIEIPKDKFLEFFQPNKSIDYQKGNHEFSTDMNHMRGIWPYFSETEKLNEELKSFF